MRTLLIDNHDSFTFNLFQLIAETYGVAPSVLPNDHLDLTAELADGFDAVVVSPGPGRPQVARDIGRSLEVVRNTGAAVLGVCLGHQGLGHLAGAPVRLAPEPRHGHLSTVDHRGTGLFAGLPQRFTVVRYHSLCLLEPLPDELLADAWSEDGVVMAVHHRSRPWWGVQFHPESVASEGGERLLANFRALVLGTRTPNVSASAPAPPPDPAPAAAPSGPPPADGPPSPWTLRTRRLPCAVDTEVAYEQLCADRPYAFWLDSCAPGGELARFSFVGHPDAPGGEVLSYDVADGEVRVLDGTGQPVGSEPGSVFDLLQGRLAQRHVGPHVDLPFDLVGGYVGYLGYELRSDAGSPTTRRAATPDAVWVFASRFVAVDHRTEQTWLVAAARPDVAGEVAFADAWLAFAAGALQPAARAPVTTPAPAPAPAEGVDPVPLLDRKPHRYREAVADAQHELRAGESYEVCLTNRLTTAVHTDGLAIYRRRRRINPAPYSAFLRLGPVEVICSSPERFMHVDGTGAIESRPIKGTAPRGTTPAADDALRDGLASSAKNRAENLMIVDLLRNDLGRVCEVGSVQVPSFMAVETYATVHQLVSTVRGRLRPEIDAVAAVRACFPGGSMTGAPKLRTMEIIDRLEDRPRGIYSGALGFFGLTGAADLNIVIRTAVVAGGVLQVGAGGAVVLASEPDEEYEEMLLKMRAGLCGISANDLDHGPAHRRPPGK
ncbi:MAG: aminodeoxychorismate synthase component I [Nocardioidaceae bacterium]|nr:aminodeoxychorismate synthase component I [Nocardioidaceae bacterium]MDQ3326240.1 aminodeoxychorismate synthase component I [Actinomycetota bacterium]